MCRARETVMLKFMPFGARCDHDTSVAARTDVACDGFMNHHALRVTGICTLMVLIWLCWPLGKVFGQQAAAEIKPPRIVVCHPLDVFQPGKTKILLRGRSLKEASEVRTDYPGMSIRILGHSAAAVPGRQTADETGDEQLELEITLPETVTTGQAHLVVVTPGGPSPPSPLLVGGNSEIVAESEPNEGFRTAQPLAFPAIVSGSIHADGNVDVFTFKLTEAKRVRMQIQAAEAGSNLDSLLTVYSATAKPIATSDDQQFTRDSLIEQMLEPGTYYVIVQDAHDRGGPAHPYRLSIAPNAQ